MADDFPIDVAQIVALFLESLFYGQRNVFLIVASLLFVFATLDVALLLRHVLDAFVWYHGPGGTVGEFADISYWVNAMKTVNYVAQTSIADGMLVSSRLFRIAETTTIPEYRSTDATSYTAAVDWSPPRFSVVVFFVAYLASNNAQYGVSDCVVQIIVRPLPSSSSELCNPDKDPTSTAAQGIAFNLIIIRIDQGKTVETTLVSELSGTSSQIQKRSLRFRMPSRRTGTRSVATDEGAESDNVGRSHAIAMVSFSSTPEATVTVGDETGGPVKAPPMAA
uniref:N/A n=1 Tax=Ganoderma boninense TaxID=34458 RepID=A0A5K1JYV7_9APHY|nr:N/A [Ganoderma boninense]